jgi:hypothetical protein
MTAGAPDVHIADSWRSVHPDARVGVLVLRNVLNPARHEGLDVRRQALWASLRARFAGQSRAQLNELETIRAYKPSTGRSASPITCSSSSSPSP